MSSQSSSASFDCSPEPAQPPNPRCGMNDLPTEIKARIVELCAEQDERFREEAKKAGLSTGKYDSAGRYQPQGRSVHAVFAVSRRFSALAAPHLFKVPKASKVDITFKCLIRRRADLFTELRFDDNDHVKLTDTVAALPTLTRLTSLHVTLSAVQRLWQYGPISLNSLSCSTGLAQYAAQAFEALHDIERLTCDTLSIESIRALVEPYSSLAELDLKFNFGVANHDGAVATILAAARHLKKLSITVINDYDPKPLFDLTPAQRSSLPPLHTLTISAPFLHLNHLSFAAGFCDTLEALALTATYTYDDRSPYTPHAFPSLTSFSLSGLYGLGRDTLDSLSPKSTPSLTSVQLDLPVADWDTNSASPLEPLEALPLLSTLRVPNFASLSSDAREDIESFCEENGVGLDFESPACETSLLPSSGGNHASRFAQSIRTTLRYLGKQVKEAEAAGSLSDLQRIKTALSTIEQGRVRDKVWELC